MFSLSSILHINNNVSFNKAAINNSNNNNNKKKNLNKDVNRNTALQFCLCLLQYSGCTIPFSFNHNSVTPTADNSYPLPNTFSKHLHLKPVAKPMQSHRSLRGGSNPSATISFDNAGNGGSDDDNNGDNETSKSSLQNRYMSSGIHNYLMSWFGNIYTC